LEKKNLKYLPGNRSIGDKVFVENFSLIKGGHRNDSASNNKIIKAFISGALPWYSPIPNIVVGIFSPLKTMNLKYLNPYD